MNSALTDLKIGVAIIQKDLMWRNIIRKEIIYLKIRLNQRIILLKPAMILLQLQIYLLDQDHTFLQIKGMKELIITIQTKIRWGKEREFPSHRSNSDTRGRRYGPNSHEKYNNKNQNYQDARRQNYDSEVNNKSDCAQISNESLNEASESISPSDKECFQNNQPECDNKDESKRQDICAGNSSKGAFFDHQRRNAYHSDTHFQDGRRDSFKRGRQNRGYRNQNNERQHPSSYRENNYHYRGGKFAQENHSGRYYNKRSRGNSYRYSREENLHYSNDKRVYNR
ncbi:hypothetical protein TNIN_191671 [Trichonephila inaurata madagascariensis]|uniref:Uncharacterized protein n=1 Tax=Trichonephila inaurata madagascariensis TaxID=2747483 RepID=A0A8X6JDI7_9ARAC|nr:hypothetical protein TNIN_191671 [Trichonephila inaurata madagascariensis]